jgi:hypothetical protein
MTFNIRRTAAFLAVALALSLPALTLPAFAQEAKDAPAHSPQPRDLSAKPTRVVLFKNGLGLIDSTINLPEATGLYRVSPLPDATLGMFWFSGATSAQLSDIRATQSMIRDRSALTITDFIEANLGKSAELRINNEWRKVTLKEIPQADSPAPGPSPRYDPYGNPVETTSIPLPTKAQFILVQEGENTAAINFAQIQEVRIAGPANTKTPRAAKTLSFTSTATVASGQPQPAQVKLTYLAQNITWAPSYRVEIVDDKKATLYAKAIIANDLTSLDNVNVELVTGYPNLEFSNIPDFFSLIPIRNLLTAIQTHGAQRRDLLTSNMMAQRSSYSDYDRAAMDTVMPPGQLTGESSEDLFFYPIKNVSLAKGERGYFEVFTSPVEYEHVYTWDVPDYISEDSYRSSQRNEPIPTQTVWHALKLTNKSTMPWTTGPGATTKSGRVLGQSMLNYTPINATTELKITQVSAINAEQSESETDRKRNAANFYGYNYDQVTVSGELQLTNYTDKPVTVKITKTLSGEVLKSDNDPAITKLARGLKSVNPKTQLTWTLTVQPGKDKSACAKYSYQVYVRN